MLCAQNVQSHWLLRILRGCRSCRQHNSKGHTSERTACMHHWARTRGSILSCSEYIYDQVKRMTDGWSVKKLGLILNAAYIFLCTDCCSLQIICLSQYNPFCFSNSSWDEAPVLQRLYMLWHKLTFSLTYVDLYPADLIGVMPALLGGKDTGFRGEVLPFTNSTNASFTYIHMGEWLLFLLLLKRAPRRGSCLHCY